MKFKAKEKSKLYDAIDHLETAISLISSVKAEYHEGRDRNDQYYGLEDLEERLGQVKADLDASF